MAVNNMLALTLLFCSWEAFAQDLLCDSSDKKYTIGDDVRVCVFFFEGMDSYGKTTANIPLDEYSVITADKLYSSVQNNTMGEDYLVQVKVGNSSTPLLPYYNGIHVGRVYNVVVHFDEGSVDSIEWDNSCKSCDECLKNDNGKVCAGERCGEPDDCDPIIFVSWMGTDEDGSYLTSASFRISQFRKYSLYGEFSDAKSQLD